MIASAKKNNLWWILLALAILLRCYHETLYLQMDSDYGIQLEAAKNFLEGKGLVNVRVHADDLGKEDLVPLTKWPVLYPLFLAALKAVSGSWFSAVMLSQVFAMLLLLRAFIAISDLFDLPAIAGKAILLFFAISPCIPYYWSATDMLTTALFLYCAALILTQENRARTWILLGILSALSAMIRFACIPNLAIVPLYFALRWFFTRDIRSLKAIAVVSVISFSITAIFYYFFPIASGRTGFISTLLSFDLYWEHLKWFDSFPAKMLFYVAPVEFRLPPSMPGLITVWRISLHVLSAFLLFIIIFRLFRYNGIWKRIRDHVDRKGKLFLFSVATVCVVAGFLVLESLGTEPENNSFGPAWMPPFWTFVYANRYFAFPAILVLLWFFICFGESRIDGKFKTVFALLLGTSLAYSLGFFCFTQYQVYAPGGNGGGTFWSTERDEIRIFEFINELEETREKRVVYAAYDLGENASLPVVSAADPLRDYHALISQNITAPPNTTLLVLQPANDSLAAAFNDRMAMTAVMSLGTNVLYRKDF